MSEMETDKPKKYAMKWYYVGSYCLVLACYALVGGVILATVIPNFFPLPIWAVLAVFIAIKLDYKFGGLASKFDQKYAAYKESNK